jgi:menaquinone-dependent protoporphyrinogen IX oxidase
MPGSKGDFLCNFINLSTIDVQYANKSFSFFPVFKNLIHNVEFPTLHYTDYIKKNQDVKIFPTHCSTVIPTSFLEKNNLKIINIIPTETYLHSIFIESFFKNHTKYYKNYNEMINRKHPAISSIGVFDGATDEEIKKVKFNIDFYLIKNFKEITDENRCAIFEKKLSELKYFSPSQLMMKLKSSSMYKELDNRGESIDYEDLYIKKDVSLLSKFFNLDQLLLSELIDKTWLPYEIDIWGHKWIPSSYGYRRNSI